MNFPQNNTPELAQWYLERGRDQKANGWVWIWFIVLPICLPFAIIYSALESREGKKKIAIGEAMNEAAGRENYVRPKGVPTNHFQRGYSAGRNSRYFPVSNTPPVEPIWN